jgi:hypothetical protein
MNNIITELSIDNHKVALRKVLLDEIVFSHSFSGGKILQCYDKISTQMYRFNSFIFKNKKNGKKVDNIVGIKINVTSFQVNSDNFKNKLVEEDILNASSFEFKFNGECGFMKFNSESGQYELWRRYDVKEDNKGNFPFIDPKWIECQPCPVRKEDQPLVTAKVEEETIEWPTKETLNDDLMSCIQETLQKSLPDYDNRSLQIVLIKRINKNNYHWPHWKQTDMGKTYLNAFNTAVKSNKIGDVKQDFTVELMGKKFQKCPGEDSKIDSYMVPHGSVCLDIPYTLRTAKGLKKICMNMPWCEGIVIHCKNGNIYKIRRENFLLKEKKPSKQKEANEFKDLENFTNVSELVALI